MRKVKGKMSKKPETLVVPDDKIFELRRMFLEKLERDGGKVPGKGRGGWLFGMAMGLLFL